MKLTISELHNPSWRAAGIGLPAFDHAAVADRTLASPKWVHFGAGNIFRAFPAAVLQTLLEAGEEDTGLIVAEGLSLIHIYSVTLEQIRQIPGVSGVITTLYDTMPGEEWDENAIRKMKEDVEAAGLRVSGIESVNIHDSIKVGDADRDQYIENYIKTLEKLGRNGIDMVCYNFMPVFDWTRSDLAKVRSDGSTVLAYDQKDVYKRQVLQSRAVVHR